MGFRLDISDTLRLCRVFQIRFSAIGIAFEEPADLSLLLSRATIPRRRFSALGYLLQQNRQFEEADLQFAKLAEGEDRELALGALYQRARTRILGVYQLDEAIAMLEKYIKGIGAGMPHLPPKAAALWRMGLAEEGLGRPERARGLYEKALRLEPDFKEARTALKKLK